MLLVFMTEPTATEPKKPDCSIFEYVIHSDSFNKQSADTQKYINLAYKECLNERKQKEQAS